MSVFRHPDFPRRLAALLLGAVLAVSGCSDDDGPTTPSPEPSLVRDIDDLNYIRGRYFFLQRPSEQLATNSRIEIGTVRLFLDDRNGSNNPGNLDALGAVDPTALPLGPDSLGGSFAALREIDDFLIKTDYFGDRFPVIVLREPIANLQVLAATYEEVLEGGTRRTVGFIPDAGDPGERALLKLIQVPRQMLAASTTDPAYFETDPLLDPFTPTRDLELKGFYDLGSTNLVPGTYEIEVRRYGAASTQPADAYVEGAASFSYLQIVGADLFSISWSGPPGLAEPDGLVDQITGAWFVEHETGILHFPDLRPFDPRVSPRPDATPEEDHFFASRLTQNDEVPGLRGRVLWPPGSTGVPGVPGGGVTPAGLEANRAPYDKRLLSVSDRKYHIRVTIPQ